MAKRLGLQANPGSLPACVTTSKVLRFPEPCFPHLLNGASNTHRKGLPWVFTA